MWLGCENGEFLLAGYMIDDQAAIIAQGGKYPSIRCTPHSRVHRVFMFLIAMDHFVAGRGGGTKERKENTL